MIKEDYVSFETAKLLKEKGFDEETEHELWYVTKQFSTGCHWNSCTYKIGDITREYDEKYCIAMPTLQMAMKWLREVHNIHIAICLGADVDNPNHIFYNPQIATFERHKSVTYLGEFDEDEFDTYEEAVEAAIKYCLEHLI